MFTIIKDTREKVGAWDFSFAAECESQIVQKLDTGDYSIVGYETVVTIDRKKTSGELYSNLFTDYARFKQELIRMKNFPYRYIICEFSLDDVAVFPERSGIPKFLWGKLKKVDQFIKRLELVEEGYGIKIIYAGSKEEAEKAALDIFNNVVKQP
jgi:ERCC4-type nuclease